MRQISLPDTHIYTPTDSETPRSQTIHYDNIQHLEQNSNLVTKVSTVNYDKTLKPADNDYSDFQDFQSTSKNEKTVSTDVSDKTEVNISDSKISQNVLYQSQAILQPVKVELSIPTLNWPDPGCVKETFDDFSDFVANSSWFTNKTENEAKLNDAEVGTVSALDDERKADTDQESSFNNNKNSLDDEFDTFQSAIPKQQALPVSDVQNKRAIQFPIKNSLPVFEFPSTNNKNFTNESSNSIDSVTPKSVSVLSPQILQPIPAASLQPKQNTGQILQPLSLESISQINWPNPGIDLQDLSRFNPVDKVHFLKSEAGASGTSRSGTPVHQNSNSQFDDDWGDFVSSKPKTSVHQPPKQQFVDDDEWSDFVSSPSARPHNGLNTISLNVHTNLNIQKSASQSKQKRDGKHLDIPSLNYITPKGVTHRARTLHDPHFQNL